MQRHRRAGRAAVAAVAAAAAAVVVVVVVAAAAVTEEEGEMEATWAALASWLCLCGCALCTPPRHRRLLIDTFHSSGYPSGYFPTDDLGSQEEDYMDAHGDHPHTNLRELCRELRAGGFHIETLADEWTSFDATQYGALLLIDPEEGLPPLRGAQAARRRAHEGLGLVAAADWFHPKLMAELYYRDEHTGSRTTAAREAPTSPRSTPFSPRWDWASGRVPCTRAAISSARDGLSTARELLSARRPPGRSC